ncbi:DJ-1/PfpI family protein [Devosia oryziradicis]|uniref:DJ-1/PfpI family protein n=1 Tax=Devosia oryziradicis TaxID=2801335 RepID=A0ABX7BUC8_9HYPH|nr:DJ-1/PfpI family protein [Devosia oryziradicis]QQR35147.1 DJ-1/PfpI family protein [Devosia oryziradicis]
MKPITIVIAEGYSDWEIAPLAGVGRAFYGADIRFASPHGGSVTSVAGLTMADTDRFEPPNDGVVVVCGGPAFEGDNPPDLSERLRQAKAAGCVIAGICGGTVALARAGLLDQVRHTSNGPGYLDQFASAYKGAGHYVDQPMALRDGYIITAAAPMPASFAMEVLAAAGLDRAKAGEIPAMLSGEHQAA